MMDRVSELRRQLDGIKAEMKRLRDRMKYGKLDYYEEQELRKQLNCHINNFSVIWKDYYDCKNKDVPTMSIDEFREVKTGYKLGELSQVEKETLLRILAKNLKYRDE